MTRAIKVGDVVRLKSGSPNMTVAQLLPDNRARVIYANPSRYVEDKNLPTGKESSVIYENGLTSAEVFLNALDLVSE